MRELDYKELGTNIRTVFLESEKYQLDKYVPTFEVDGKFIGDFFNMTMFESNGDKAPTFYHIYSPYDVISNEAPQWGSVMSDGELRYHDEVTDYVRQRTGVMTSLVLQALGTKSLEDKAVLFVGTGKIAMCDLAALKVYYPELDKIAYINNISKPTEFAELAATLQIKISEAAAEDIGYFDVIICHTSSKEPVLTSNLVSRVKPGAFIANYASEDHQEVAKDYYNNEFANVIIDWDQTIEEAVELKDAVEKGLIATEDIIRVKDLFAGNTHVEDSKYTVYRSHGTPMQNLAFLQLLYKS